MSKKKPSIKSIVADLDGPELPNTAAPPVPIPVDEEEKIELKSVAVGFIELARSVRWVQSYLTWGFKPARQFIAGKGLTPPPEGAELEKHRQKYYEKINAEGHTLTLIYRALLPMVDRAILGDLIRLRADIHDWGNQHGRFIGDGTSASNADLVLWSNEGDRYAAMLEDFAIALGATPKEIEAAGNRAHQFPADLVYIHDDRKRYDFTSPLLYQLWRAIRQSRFSVVLFGDIADVVDEWEGTGAIVKSRG
jgi:hypothetical protein